MRVALTGATGFVGSRVLTELRDHGHEVTALVRDSAGAGRVEARGAVPAVVDLYDRAGVARLLGKAEGAIHVASPGDATSADLDAAVVGLRRRQSARVSTWRSGSSITVVPARSSSYCGQPTECRRRVEKGGRSSAARHQA
jgi:uncharacterized protein YbjT (DUF2867 family)